jgi:hypothetical protein
MYYYTVDRCFLDRRHLISPLVSYAQMLENRASKLLSNPLLFLAIRLPNLLLFLTNLDNSLGPVLLPMSVRNKHCPFISSFEVSIMYNQILQQNCILYTVS